MKKYVLWLFLAFFLCSCSIPSQESSDGSVVEESGFISSQENENTEDASALDNNTDEASAPDTSAEDKVYYTSSGEEYLRLKGGGTILSVTEDHVIYSRPFELGRSFFLMDRTTGEVTLLGEDPEELRASHSSCQTEGHFYILFYTGRLGEQKQGDRIFDIDLQNRTMNVLYDDPEKGSVYDVMTCIDGKRLLLAQYLNNDLIQVDLYTGEGTLIRHYDWNDEGDGGVIRFVSEGDDKTAVVLYFHCSQTIADKAFLDIFDEEMDLIETVDLSSLLEKNQCYVEDPTQATLWYISMMWRNSYFYCNSNGVNEFLGHFNGEELEEVADLLAAPPLWNVGTSLQPDGYMYFATQLSEYVERENMIFRFDPQTGEIEAALLPGYDHEWIMSSVGRYADGSFVESFFKDNPDGSKQYYSLIFFEDELTFEKVDLTEHFKLEELIPKW